MTTSTNILVAVAVPLGSFAGPNIFRVLRFLFSPRPLILEFSLPPPKLEPHNANQERLKKKQAIMESFFFVSPSIPSTVCNHGRLMGWSLRWDHCWNSVIGRGEC